MAYDKPKVTIDLEEYNQLLKLKEVNYDVDEIATIAMTVGLNARGQYNSNSDINRVINEFCSKLNYTMEASISNTHSDYYGSKANVRIIKKPI